MKRYAVDYLERVGSFAYTRRVLRDLSKRAMALIDELEGKVEGLPSGAGAAPGPGPPEMMPSGSFLPGSIHQKRDALEDVTMLQNSPNDTNISSLPMEVENNKHSANPTDNHNSSSSRNKHVRIGHGVRQILEKLKVDTPKPATTANPTSTNNTNSNAAGIGSSPAAFVSGYGGGGANGSELGSGSSVVPPQSLPEAAPESDKTQIPQASSPSTPMAMTEIPVTGTKAVDGNDGNDGNMVQLRLGIDGKRTEWNGTE